METWAKEEVLQSDWLENYDRFINVFNYNPLKQWRRLSHLMWLRESSLQLFVLLLKYSTKIPVLIGQPYNNQNMTL